jgi:3-dehydroquinate dehydratase / shikimate dehydrogenase
MKSERPVRVCVPVCAKTFAQMEEACARASDVADLIEVRLDCIEGDVLVEKVKELLSRVTRPVIVTLRAEEQGGYRALTRPQRKAFWEGDWGVPGTALFDIEADLVTELSLDRSKVIVSHHDFSGVPDDLDRVYERLAAMPAHVVKIAVNANDITDCIPVFHLLEHARRQPRNLIAIAMGNAGIATRILGPSKGAFLTYGSLEDAKATAPGQVNADALRSVYRIDEIDNDTMICGLVGLPVMHSVSPHMHNAAFGAEGVNGVYLPLEVRDIEAFVKRMVRPVTREIEWNLRGLSVTAPHKSQVIPFLDWVHPKALEIGAVNTVVVENDRLLGYNTDADGIVEPLKKRDQSLFQRVAIIGAGGAARTAVWVMKLNGAEVTIFARDPRKAQQSFDVPCESLQTARFRDYDLVINASPVGSGEFVGHTPALAEQLDGVRLVYDLIYNPTETQFLKEGRIAGCDTLGGLEMLVAQARLQFELWTRKKPSAAVMHAAAAAALEQ